MHDCDPKTSKVQRSVKSQVEGSLVWRHTATVLRAPKHEMILDEYIKIVLMCICGHFAKLLFPF